MIRTLIIVATLWTLAVPCLAAQPPSPWLWSPYLGAVGTDFAAISWKTARPVTIDLRYARVSEGDAAEHWDEILTFEQQEGIGEIWLRGLVPASTYRYQVTAYEGVAGYPTRLGTLRTLAEDPSTITFLAYGETRLLADRHQLVADAMAEGEPQAAFVVHVGGLVEAPDAAHYTNLFWAIADLAGSRPYIPVHDDARNVGEEYYETFALPVGGGDGAEQWWSFDYGCLHVVGLDSALVGVESEAVLREEVAWLRGDLARSAQSARFVVVFCSTPLYSACPTAASQTLRDAWDALFVEYGVDVVISGGHGGYEHIFQNGIHYVLTAGGGGPLSSETCDSAAGTVSRRINALHYLRITAFDGTLRVDAIPVAWVTDDDVLPTPTAEPMDSFVVEGN
ncbi:MAG: hypothetical protein PHU43_05440 [Candidatus Bipolaricaulis sp.]|nr:hypothetical protein [Candidatus Bipolaricaulis sp.]